MDELFLVSSPQLHLLARILKEYLSELVNVGTTPSSLPSSPFTFPSNICGLVYTRHRTVAKVVSAWLGELMSIASRSNSTDDSVTKKKNVFSFLRPDYVFLRESTNSLDDLTNPYIEKCTKSLHDIHYYRRQEEVLKRFRFSNNCNILVTTSTDAEGLDVNRCNLMVCMDVPQTFRQFIQTKGRVRVDRGLYVVMVSLPLQRRSSKLSSSPFQSDYAETASICSPEEDFRTKSYISRFLEFIEMEKIFSKLLPVNHVVNIEEYHSEFQLFDSEKDCVWVDAALVEKSNQLPYRSRFNNRMRNAYQSNKHSNQPTETTAAKVDSVSTNPPSDQINLTMENAISILNRYCLKLPSDTFTKLSPYFVVSQCPAQPSASNSSSQTLFQCSLSLPINSTFRDQILGEPCPSKQSAKQSAAFKAVSTLRSIGELDANFFPVGKETNRYIEKLGLQECFIPNNASANQVQVRPSSNAKPNSRYQRVHARNVASKMRQYYDKKVSSLLQGVCFKREVFQDSEVSIFPIQLFIPSNFSIYRQLHLKNIRSIICTSLL